MCKGGQSERPEVEQRFYLFFSSRRFYFFRTQKKFSCNIISHTHTTSGKPSYWDERYTKDPEAFDWYQRYSGIKEILGNSFEEKDTIINIGCGNSRLSEDMVEDGYKSITNIDISKVVIDQMLSKLGDKAGLTWKQMDATTLDFPDEHFDSVIIKGTMDAILCGEGSTTNVAKMCAEVSRVMKSNSVFIVVSYGIPENRLSYLENSEYNWKVEALTFRSP